MEEGKGVYAVVIKCGSDEWTSLVLESSTTSDLAVRHRYYMTLEQYNECLKFNDTK